MIALADAFIQWSVENGSEHFKVAWYKSDTTVSIQYLKDGVVDVGITYSPAAEDIAIKQGIAKSPSYYAFRDHFIVVGPPSNPADIDESADVLTIFSKLHEAAEAATSTPPVRFLSRYDKSATNIKESDLWIGIGQVCATLYPLSHNVQDANASVLCRFLGPQPIRPGIINISHSQSKR